MVQVPEKEQHDPESIFQQHTVSPAPESERLQSIQRLVAEHLGEDITNFRDDVLHAIPIQAESLYPITGIWYIEPGLDTPSRLHAHIVQFAREIPAEVGDVDAIIPIAEGSVFSVHRFQSPLQLTIRHTRHIPCYCFSPH